MHQADERARRRLIAFYEHYNPTALNRVDEILTVYEGEEEQLFSDLRQQYGPEPGAAASSGGGGGGGLVDDASANFDMDGMPAWVGEGYESSARLHSATSRSGYPEPISSTTAAEAEEDRRRAAEMWGASSPAQHHSPGHWQGTQEHVTRRTLEHAENRQMSSAYHRAHGTRPSDAFVVPKISAGAVEVETSAETDPHLHGRKLRSGETLPLRRVRHDPRRFVDPRKTEEATYRMYRMAVEAAVDRECIEGGVATLDNVAAYQRALRERESVHYRDASLDQSSSAAANMSSKRLSKPTSPDEFYRGHAAHIAARAEQDRHERDVEAVVHWDPVTGQPIQPADLQAHFALHHPGSTPVLTSNTRWAESSPPRSSARSAGHTAGSPTPLGVPPHRHGVTPASASRVLWPEPSPPRGAGATLAQHAVVEPAARSGVGGGSTASWVAVECECCGARGWLSPPPPNGAEPVFVPFSEADRRVHEAAEQRERMGTHFTPAASPVASAMASGASPSNIFGSPQHHTQNNATRRNRGVTVPVEVSVVGDASHGRPLPPGTLGTTIDGSAAAASPPREPRLGADDQSGAAARRRAMAETGVESAELRVSAAAQATPPGWTTKQNSVRLDDLGPSSPARHARAGERLEGSLEPPPPKNVAGSPSQGRASSAGFASAVSGSPQNDDDASSPVGMRRHAEHAGALGGLNDLPEWLRAQPHDEPPAARHHQAYGQRVDPNEVAPAADPRRFAQVGGAADRRPNPRDRVEESRTNENESPTALEETVRGGAGDGPPPRLVEESVGDASEIAKPVVPAEVSRRPTHDVDDTFKPYAGGGGGGGSSTLHKSDSDASLTDLGPGAKNGGAGTVSADDAAAVAGRRRAQSVTHGAFDSIPRVESIAASSFAGRNRANTAVAGSGGLAEDRANSSSLWPSQRDRSHTGLTSDQRPDAKPLQPAQASPAGGGGANAADAVDDDPW